MKGELLAKYVDTVRRTSGHEGLMFKLAQFVPVGYVPKSTLDTGGLLTSGLWRPSQTMESIIDTLFDYYEKGNAPKPLGWNRI